MYLNHMTWPKMVQAHCLHCDELIKGRPCTVGTEKSQGAIVTRGYFCSWFCVKTYMIETQLCKDESAMRCTNKLFNTFMEQCDDYDNKEYVVLAKKFDNFYNIPQIAFRHEFVCWGGKIDSSDKFTSMRDGAGHAKVETGGGGSYIHRLVGV